MKLHIKPKAGSGGFLPWPWSLPSGQAKNKGSFFKQEFINVTTKALMKTSRPWRKPHGLKPLAPHRLARKAQLSLSHTGTSDQLFLAAARRTKWRVWGLFMVAGKETIKGEDRV